MTRIGLLSDTHSFLDSKVFQYFETCDEVWHAGDIGSMEILDQLQRFRKGHMVYGNIDDHRIRRELKEVDYFELEGHRILLIHIAGPFGKYTPQVRSLIEEYQPSILVCGHSHILKVAFDQKHQLLYLNPGACGKSGFHKVRTLIRFAVDGKQILDMEVIELHDA
ncbi:MAG TPA: metallophosphoesterase family protein [Saprospiraceae bacterium]|nr:metallophosphoesterase family protein [Saprospiraceae bacterium]